MSCQTIDYSGQSVSVNRGPAMEEVERTSEGVKWCFHCRNRQEFFYIVTAPVEPSYYGPTMGVHCGRCKTSDGDMFPGGYREWVG